MHHRLLIAALLGVASASAAADVSPSLPAQVTQFMQQNCIKCHGPKSQKAGLRLDNLGANFLQGRNAETWHDVTDRINLGEMPPDDELQPDPKESAAFVNWIGNEMRRAEHEARVAGGRSLMRRLNRDEYANTVGDLLHLDPEFVKQVREELPADGKAEGFDRLGSALFFDETQMEQYLAVADLIAKRAIQDAPPEVKKDEFVKVATLKYPPDTTEVPNIKTKTPVALGYVPFKLRDGGVELWSQSYYGGNKREFGFLHSPIVNSSLTGMQKIVTQDGYYRLRIKAGRSLGERGEPIRMRFIWGENSPIESRHDVEIKGTLDQPEVVEATVFLRAGLGEQQPKMTLNWNGLRARINNPLEFEYYKKSGDNTKALEKAIAAHAPESELAPLRQKAAALYEDMYNNYHGPTYVLDPTVDVAKVPHLFLQSIELEGPIVEWPPASHAALGVTDATTPDEAGARAVFAKLLPRAYRRPVLPDETERLVHVVTRAMEKHHLSFRDALRLGLQTMLCSPQFTFLQEPKTDSPQEATRPLSDFELACRLSYFLWSTMPDEELFALAAHGQLKSPATLRTQVTRMLAAPKARHFVENFAGQWLSVRDYGSVKPDPKEYSAYDHDLEVSETEEPLAFFQEVLSRNLPVTCFLDSDFLVINERLAAHYGIKGVKGEVFQTVPIGPELHRGGVLGMAGLLTLLADGTRTLPVRRAAWVRGQLLDDPPLPPPPNAGAIQPNAAGKNLTVRERLEKHRNEPTCASCHRKLDSYGLALENYDAVGAWRTKQNGEGLRGGSLPLINPSGQLKSGLEFHDLASYKAALLTEKDKFARALATKLLTYALCRPVGYVDHETVDQVTGVLRADDYRLQTLVQAVVASAPFQSR